MNKKTIKSKPRKALKITKGKNASHRGGMKKSKYNYGKDDM